MAMGTVNLKPGVLRLFEWTKDFNMHKHRNTHAQVWIRLLELPQEYWMDRTLREIASAVGTPLLIDNATSKRIYGHYARILVDMDFSRQLFHEITVEREGYAFQVEVAYEWLPEFCTHCHTLGHDVSSCRWLYPQKDKTVHKHYKKNVILRHFLCDPYVRTVAECTFTTVIATGRVKSRKIYCFFFQTLSYLSFCPKYFVTPSFLISFSLPQFQNPKIQSTSPISLSPISRFNFNHTFPN
jgi:hypothetical protein